MPKGEKNAMRIKNETPAQRDHRMRGVVVSNEEVVKNTIIAPPSDVIHRFLTGRPPAYSTEEELQREIEGYFNSLLAPIIDENGEQIGMRWMNKPTVGGLAVYLGIDRTSLHRYSKSDRFYDSIKKAKDLIHSFNEQMLMEGKNPVGAINTLINTSEFWVSDQKNIKVEPVLPDAGAKPVDEIATFLDTVELPGENLTDEN